MTSRKPTTSPNGAPADAAAIKDMRRLIERHGARAMRVAVDEVLPPQRGRPKADDWGRLAGLLDEDVREVLMRGSPFATTNYAIARAFAAAEPGQSEKSTIRRIEKKLKGKDSRRYHVFFRAWRESLDAYPHGVHLLALKELSAIQPDGPWPVLLERAEANVAAYTAKHGPPLETLPVKEIEDGARDALHTGLLALARSRPA